MPLSLSLFFTWWPQDNHWHNDGDDEHDDDYDNVDLALHFCAKKELFDDLAGLLWKFELS